MLLVYVCMVSIMYIYVENVLNQCIDWNESSSLYSSGGRCVSVKQCIQIHNGCIELT